MKVGVGVFSLAANMGTLKIDTNTGLPIPLKSEIKKRKPYKRKSTAGMPRNRPSRDNESEYAKRKAKKAVDDKILEQSGEETLWCHRCNVKKPFDS